jgi:predicted MFS family arabinose efflux permease
VDEKRKTTGMSSGMTFLFAVAGAAAVGNLYWAQPLLNEIATELGLSLSLSGTLLTVTQLGYALGVLLLVPLGDVLNRRRFIPVVMVFAAIALFASGFAPTYQTLLPSLAAVGLTAVAGQLLLPLAGDLAHEHERGRVIGSIASGILTGILLSRTISGLVADTFGWRAIYIAAGAVTAGLAVLIVAKLPDDRPRPPLSYGKLLASIYSVVQRNNAAQVTLVLGACAFSVFTMFWTGLTFLLSAPPFSYSLTQIGLVGLVGLAGALAARRAGKLHDMGWSTPAAGLGLILTLASLAIAAAGSTSIVLILIAVLFIDIAIQGVNVLNQTRLFSIEPQSRSRLNTAFVVCNFIGGAIGSVLAGLLWQAGGWYLLTGGEAVIIIIGLIVWFLFRSTLRAVEATHDTA